MTRKKFIKLLMWQRLDRNTASRMADRARFFGIPYTKALGDFLTLVQLRVYNALYDGTVWQPATANAWVGVLTE